jgi:uncharacterized protein (TIGR02266 family)
MSDAAKVITVVPGNGRRSVPRAHLAVEVDFNDQTTFYTGFSENISSGGVFIATYNLQEIGKKISVSLTLPSGITVSVEGTVQWIREMRDSRSSDQSPGFGIQFDSLSPEAKLHIEEFVEQQEPMFYAD